MLPDTWHVVIQTTVRDSAQLTRHRFVPSRRENMLQMLSPTTRLSVAIARAQRTVRKGGNAFEWISLCLAFLAKFANVRKSAPVVISVGCFLSVDSFLPVGSLRSVDSFLSVGSLRSVGSFLAVGSFSSVSSVHPVRSFLSVGSSRFLRSFLSLCWFLSAATGVLVTQTSLSKVHSDDDGGGGVGPAGVVTAV